jgi:hypothetical protein
VVIGHLGSDGEIYSRLVYQECDLAYDGLRELAGVEFLWRIGADWSHLNSLVK